MLTARSLLAPLVLLLAAGALVAPAAHAGLDGGTAVPQAIRADERVERVLYRDLDGDDILDAVVVTRERARDALGGHGRRLLFLRGGGRGRYSSLDYGSRRNLGTSARVLLCTRCGGALHATGATPVSVSIRRGVVVVRQDSGSREVLAQTFRFRMRTRLVAVPGGRASRSTVRLIGYDDERRDRGLGTSTARSWNLLTGATLVEARDARGTVTRRETGTRRRAPITLERVVPATLWP